MRQSRRMSLAEALTSTAIANSPTQEKVREAVAKLEHAAYGGDEVAPVYSEHLRTLLAAYTRMEADMAEARQIIAKWALPYAALRGSDAEEDALAAFYNKGEE